MAKATARRLNTKISRCFSEKGEAARTDFARADRQRYSLRQRRLYRRRGQTIYKRTFLLYKSGRQLAGRYRVRRILRSHFGKFSDEDVAKVVKYYKSDFVYDAVKKCAEKPDELSENAETLWHFLWDERKRAAFCGVKDFFVRSGRNDCVRRIRPCR